MSASQQSGRPRIAVVGGGISGLAAAYRLLELSRERSQPIDLKLFEASGRLGGVISTERTDGFVIEGGADSFLSEKPAGLHLCERLGLTSRLVGTREEFRRTYVVHGGRLHPLPDGFLLLAPTQFWPLVTSSLFSWPGKLRMALDLILPQRTDQGDESLAAFVTRRLGREALERVAQPLVGGIYTADPDRLSLAATMPRFLDMERQHRSVIRAMWRNRRQGTPASDATSGTRWSLFVSIDDGMQTLVDTLARQLPDDTIQLRASVRSLERSAGNRWRLNGDTECDAVVLATRAHVTAELIADTDDSLASELRAIPYASSATVTLSYRREDIPHPLDGFGFVVPHIEGRSILACTFSSLKFPERSPTEFVLLRAFVGGMLQPQAYAQEDAEMVASVRTELRELLGVSAEPSLRRIHRYADAMPQYNVGHLEHAAGIKHRIQQLPGLAISGSAYHGVGIPDCISSGEKAAETTMDSFRASAPADPRSAAGEIGKGGH